MKTNNFSLNFLWCIDYFTIVNNNLVILAWTDSENSIFPVLDVLYGTQKNFHNLVFSANFTILGYKNVDNFDITTHVQWFLIVWTKYWIWG